MTTSLFHLTFHALVVGLVSSTFVGCSSVKALPEGASRGTTTQFLRPPAQIFVQPFDKNSGKWEGRAAREPLKSQIRDWLAASLEQTLAEMAPTRLAVAELPPSGWLVTGRFIRVNPGSKLQRAFVGLGAGGSRLETKVAVYDLAVSTTEPLFIFTTTGGSNMVGGPHTILSNTPANDVERTAREVRDFLQQHVWKQDPHDAASPPLGGTALTEVEMGSHRASGR